MRFAFSAVKVRLPAFTAALGALALFLGVGKAGYWGQGWSAL